MIYHTYIYTHTIYKVYIKLVCEVTEGILHWHITLFKQYFSLCRVYPVMLYKTHSRFISLEIASLMLPSKNKLFFGSPPFTVYVIYPSSIKQGKWDFKFRRDLPPEFTQCTSRAPHFLYNIPKMEA